MTLRPQARIRKAEEFQACRANGSKVFSKNLVCQFSKNTFSHARIGLIVTKKTGSSVVRNRWKRVIRDFFRTHERILHPKLDYVFIVKSTVKGKPLTEIRDELEKLVRKIKIS